MVQRAKKCNHAIFDQHCTSCVKLQNEWYKKLETDAKKNPTEGFVDIERHGKYEGMLKMYSTEFFSPDYAPEVYDAKQEYYILATNFLEEYKFETKREQVIWEYHSLGISMRDISKLLKKIRVKMGKTEVCLVVNRLKLKMYDMYVSPRPAYHE